MRSNSIQEEDRSVVVLNCEWMTNLKEKIEKTPLKDARVERATIFRVPKNIRTSDTYGAIYRVPENISPAGDPYGEACHLGDAYDPKIVSLGPYHRGKPCLQEWDNRLKWPSLKKFLNRSRDKTQAMENCIKKIKELESEARSAYAEEVKMTSNEFVEMMLLDCCFVLELLVELMVEQEEQEKKKRKDEEKLPKRIEWKKTLICKLIPVFKKKPEKQKPLATAVSSLDPEAVNTKQTSKEEHSEEERTLIRQWKWAKPLIAHDLLMLENQIPLRLLRELHSIILGHDKSASMNKIIVSFFKQFSLTSNINEIPEVCGRHHLLHLYHSCLIQKKQDRGVPGDVTQVVEPPARSTIPCARDLIYSQVDIKKQKDSSNFLDLRFNNSCCGCRGSLEIPVIHIDDDTNTLLRNLIAFEQCYPTIGDDLSTYAWFMDSLIDSSADVALLRREGVLVSGLGSDEEVARLFNSLCKEVIVEPNRCYLEKTIKEVTEYCDSKYHRCCAILNHSYFSNPWASISVVAAIILFVLTFIQTLYSICDSCYRA